MNETAKHAAGTFVTLFARKHCNRTARSKTKHYQTRLIQCCDTKAGFARDRRVSTQTNYVSFEFVPKILLAANSLDTVKFHF